VEYPSIKLDYFKELTDQTGMLQHAKYSIPDKREGYTTDDNARALIVAAKLAPKYPELKSQIRTYLSFLLYMQRHDGRLHNFLGYDRRILDDAASEECMGRALWACGTCVNSALNAKEKNMSKEIFDKTYGWVNSFKSLRAKAFSILGLHQYSLAYPEDKNPLLNIKPVADYLIYWYTVVSSDKWRWFEPYVTYENARLPHALFAAYTMTGHQKYLQVAVKSLGFLMKTQIIEDKFVPVGSNGWYNKHGKRAFYDQQPVETSCMVDALNEAKRITGDEQYSKLAQTVFEWFFGNNTKNVVVYDAENGGCYDGINPDGLNLNQGAESTLSYLLTRLSIEELNLQK
jgi:hypothetical protein